MERYTCEKCGGEVQRTTKTCPHCGVMLNGIRCGACRHVYSQSQSKCPNCGVKNPNKPSSKGCYVATAVYGSYDCPQVWTLRRYRDDALQSTLFGLLFVRLYYSISPVLVKYFGATKIFHSFCKQRLDRFVAKLQALGYDSTPYYDE